MDPTIIEFEKCDFDIKKIVSDLKIRRGTPTSKELNILIDEARKIANPKAIYTITSIEKLDDRKIILNGIEFNSRLLCTNLDSVHRSFPFIATCGVELDTWKNSIKDTITKYFADHISGLVLDFAYKSLVNHIKNRYGLNKTATMNPGSLEDWPLEAQTSLFKLLGNPEEEIGVRLTDSLLMVPRQSISGILFETETDFVNCQLCPRKKCPNRRAPYNEVSAKEFLSKGVI